MNEGKIRKSKILVIVVLIALIVGGAIYAYASQLVKIQISQMPNVDIILTKAQTQADLSNFEAELKRELIQQNVMSEAEIESGKVNIQAIDTQTIESQEEFSWEQDVSSAIGSVSFQNNGKNVVMTGNRTNAGKNAIWILPEGNQEQHFNFDYSINYGDSFNAAGMLLRVRKNSNGYLEGYMISFNNSGSFRTGANGSLWHFIYDGNNTTAFRSNTDIQLISNINIAKSGNLDIKVTDTEIIINGGGLSSEFKYEFKAGESYGEGYGFFSDHYSHGCNNIGSFTLRNINLETQVVKKFTEVLQAPDWRDGSLRILVDVEDMQNEQFADQNELTAIIAKLMNSDVYYIGWGTEENKEQMENLIEKNDGKGIYVENSSEEAVQATVEYIKRVIKPNVGNTIIAGEPVKVEITSPEEGVETPTEEYPTGVWKVVHEDKYYKNAQNQYELNNIYTNELIKEFNNVGKYYIYCEDKLVTEVYAHRRPVSAFNMKVMGTQVSLTSTSYDLDIEANTENTNEQEKNNGIKSEKWEYKNISNNDTSWTQIDSTGIGQEQIVNLEANSEYMIKLTVTDYQGVESTSTKYITTGESILKPIASFKVTNKTISMYDKLEVIDESYDPSGMELTYKWTVTKGKEEVYSGEEPLVDFSTTNSEKYGIGTYKITLVVSKNVEGQAINSEAFSQTIEIVEDTTPPAIIVDPTTQETQREDIKINVNMRDQESGLASYKYAFTENADPVEEESWSEDIEIEGNERDEEITLSKEKIDEVLYLHIKATNKDGATSEEKVTGPYYINPYKVIMQVADKNTGRGIEGAEYNITGEKENGTTVEIAKEVQTDADGKITIEKAKLKDVERIKIENTKEVVGYEGTENKTIKINTETSKIVVDESESSQDIEIGLEDEAQTLKVRVPVEREKFELKITNIDSQSKNLIEGVEYSLKKNGIEVAKGKTEEGKVSLQTEIGEINTEEEYVLEQVKINEEYTNIGKVYLKIKFNEEGKVVKVSQKLFASNKAVTIEDETKAEILIENTRKDTSKFEVNINVKDHDKQTNIENSKYKVKVEGENNLNYVTQTYATNGEGNIRIEELYGTGLLKLTFIHEEAAEGYRRESVDRYITIYRSESGEITYNQASMSGVYEKTENGVVYVNLENAKKQSENTIKVNIVSKNDNEVGLEKIGVKIYKLLDNSLVATGETDENGQLEIENIENDGNGEVIYKLQIENDVLGIMPIFIINYQGGKITDAYKMDSNEDVKVYYSEEDDEEAYKYVANIEINGSLNNITGEDKLTITQEAKETGRKIEGGQYKVKITGSESILTERYTTNEEGEVEVALINDKNIKIEIEQIKAVEGYKLDRKVKTIELTKNTKGMYEVKAVNNIEIGQIEIDENGNLDVVDYIYSNKNTLVNVQIAKTDANGELDLGGFKFKVKEETTQYEEEIKTVSNQYIETEEGFIATEGKSYILQIEETQSVSPYKIIEEPIKIQMSFHKEGEQVTYKDISYLQGEEYLLEAQAEYFSENNEVIVSLKILNHTETNFTEGILYDLDIEKVNEQGEKVSGSKYDIEIRPYAESSIVSKEKTIDDNIEISNLAIRTDKTTILLKETNAGIGYGIDGQIKVVTLEIDENGKLTYVEDTTSKDLEISITEGEKGTNKKIVKITITAKEGEEEEPPKMPEESERPEEEIPAEVRPEDATVALKVFNKSYGNWTKTYRIRQQISYYRYRNTTGSYKLDSAQKLERIFKDTEEAQQYGFNFITGAEITVETRLITDNVVSGEIYETSVSKGNTEVNDKNGTDSIYLYKDYANKTVEMTFKQNVPAYNYKRATTDVVVRVKFDGNGKIASGEIIQGNDTEDFAIGGISTQGIVENIQYLSYAQRSIWGKESNHQYVQGEITEYNCIGEDTIYFGLLNKQYISPLEIAVKLQDYDTNGGIDGEVSAVVMEKTEEGYKSLDIQTLSIKDGTGTLKLNATYANRTLRIELLQISNGRKGNVKYLNEATVGTQFEVELDDDGNIKTLTQLSKPENVEYNGATGNKVQYTIYNSIIYNFAINVKKLDENGEPLKGVRLESESYYITNKTQGTGVKVFEYGSQKTDENGNTKLKIVLPDTGTYRYNGATMDFVINEYYVPDNYKAIEGVKIRVLFSDTGEVKDTQIITEDKEGRTQVTGINEVQEGEMEQTSINITLKNEQVEEKPVLQITNKDSDDNQIVLEGTKYKVSVWDEEEYTENDLVINETRYSMQTNETGETTIYFENAHALRTMIYRIEEVETANSYQKNNDILIRIKYDKDGKIATKPEILTNQKINVPNVGSVDVVKIEGNPVGSTLLKLDIINELKPRFTIKITKNEKYEKTDYTGSIFKGIAQKKTEEGTYEEAEEERISYKMVENYAEIGFKKQHADETILYTILEQTGETYTERGKIEVTFDEYGNVKSQETTGKYITRTTFQENTNYVNTYIQVEKFRMNIEVESKNKEVNYSLSGYKFNIENSKGEYSGASVKTDNMGNVTEIVGEVYKGETITYEIQEVENAIDYEPIENITLTVEFDEEGNIISCTPSNIEGTYDLITTIKDEETYINMEIRMYVEPSQRSKINIRVEDELDSEKLVQNVIYDVEVGKEKNYDLIVLEGEGSVDVGSYQNYRNETILYTLRQTEIDEKYMIHDADIQISVTYDNEGKITNARMIASDGYAEIDQEKTIGTTQIELKTKNKEKTVMQVNNINKEREEEGLAGAKFKIIQKDKTDLYSDTKITNAEGKAELYVGPYYKEEEITYKITTPTPAYGFKEIEETEFTLTYNKKGEVIESHIPVAAQEYMSIEIPEKGSELYGNTDIVITVKSQPLFTVGVEAVNEKTQEKLAGGKYEIVQTNKEANKGTAITETGKIAHASVGETEAGETVTYKIIEKQAPLGYKYKDKDKSIGEIQVTYDGEGKIIKGTPKLLSGYEYITIKDATDKPEVYDVDIQIGYEEIEELNIIIENQNILDNTDKIESTFNGQMTTGMSAQTTTDKDTGLGILAFGKVTTTNSRQTLTISQSNIQGGYTAIANIRMTIEFDESGKIKKASSISGSSYATEGVAYSIDQVGEYTIKITVKNNPETSINIISVSDGNTELRVDSKYEVTGIESGKIELQTENGEVSKILETVPKNRRVNYVLKHISVDRGYTLNKDIIITVNYDSDGKITNAYQTTNAGSADASVIEKLTYTEYQINLEIKNKQEFRIYVDTQDKYNEQIKIPNMSVYLKETNYSKKSVNLQTDENGSTNTILGSTMANGYLDYEVRVLSTAQGYDAQIQKTKYNIRVYFGSNGEIINCETNSDLIEVNYGSGLALEIKVKYVPLLNMEINRTNTSTNTALTGRTITISSSALETGTEKRTTDGTGKIKLEAGRIEGNNTVVYNISEQELITDTNFEKLPTMQIYITYDEKGNIANVTVSDTNYVNANITGERSVEIQIGTKKVSTIAITNVDYYNHTVNVSGGYEITSDKGEKATITSTTGMTNVIAELGKVYSGEKITYTIHQISNQEGYEIVEDQSFMVQYNLDGTIETVEAKDTDRVEIKAVNQNNSKTQPNIMLQIHSKATLEVNVKVTDNIYHSGVEGLGFKVINEETGIETTVEAKTNEQGILKISVPTVYENKTVRYIMKQTNSFGGYKAIEDIEFVVSYGNLGTIHEEGTYIINPKNEKITQGYSEELYKNQRIKGIQIEIEAETQNGIGIEKVDVYGNKLNGIEYTITAKEENSEEVQNWRSITNVAGEAVTYTGEMPKSKVIEYTISELEAPAGYRKTEDTIIKVYYNAEGRISTYSIIQQSENVEIEIATSELVKMSEGREVVHLKVRITNDDRVSFRIVNKESHTEEEIVGAKFDLSVEGNDGTIVTKTLETNKKGQVTLENVEGSGELTLYFNQSSVPENISMNSQNRGYMTIYKDSENYRLTYMDGSENLNYTIENETGIVTIYLENDNNLILNIADIDSETQKEVYNASHTIKVQYGEINEKLEEILEKEDNIVLEEGPYNSEQAITKIELGSTYALANKKVVYTIKTPILPEKNQAENSGEEIGEEETKEVYNEIKDQYVVVEFDEKGQIKNIKGETSRLALVNNPNGLTMNVVIEYGNIDNYTIKVAKESELDNMRINGATFNIKIEAEGKVVENFEGETTGVQTINGVTIEEGIIILKKLKYEGNMKVTLTETQSPEGFEGLINVPIEISFNAQLDKTDIDEVKLKVENIQVPSQKAKVEVNEINRQIEITIVNKPVLNIEITKQDENGNQLTGINFNMLVQNKENMSEIVDYGKITTTEEGKIRTAIDAKYADQTIFITLTEEKNENFQQIAPITIEAYINERGEIQTDTVRLLSGGTSAKITNITSKEIKIEVINKLEEYVKPYEINVVKTDENDENLRIANVLFQVKVTPEVGIPVYKAVLTDQNGEINLKGLVGSGNIIIELREIQAPEGYELGENEGYYRYEIQKQNDVLQLVSSNVAEELIDIDNANKLLNIKVPNKSKLVGIAINKVDAEDTEINIGNTSFELREEGSDTTYVAKTDDKGLAYFGVKRDTSGIVKYILKEIEASEGYQLDETEKIITIEYGEGGTIKGTAESEGIEITEKRDKYVRYEVGNQIKDIGIEPYKVKVINVDEQSKDKTIPNAQFNIKITQTKGANLIDTTKLTNEEGMIRLQKVNGAGDIEIHLENTKAGEGYIINNKELKVKLNRNEQSGKINVLESQNVTAEYDEANGEVIIYVESKKESNKYTMVLNLVDKDTNEFIKENKATYEVNIAGENKTIEANANGQMIIQGLTIPEVEEFDIEVKEAQGPEGYKDIEKTQKIKVKVTEVYNDRVLYKVEIAEGENIQILATTEEEVQVNLMYEREENAEEEQELYLTSDVYRVTEKNVERISSGKTVKEFLKNMKSNGEMKIYDKEGKEVEETQKVGTGMKIVATKGEESITKALSVIGDVTGDGEIKALDISIMKQYLIGKKELEGEYFLAADINDDGEVKALDVSKVKQAIIGTIIL